MIGYNRHSNWLSSISILVILTLLSACNKKRDSCEVVTEVIDFKHLEESRCLNRNQTRVIFYCMLPIRI